jgi:hypothetical protein
MPIKFYVLTTFFVLLILLSCKNISRKTGDNNFLANVPYDKTQQFIDSISSKIAKSVPMGYNGYPTPQKGKFYYDERPVKDSAGELKMYFVYKISSDTLELIEHFFFYQKHLIKVRIIKIQPNFFGQSFYYIRDNDLFCSDTKNMPLLSTDSLNKLATLYLQNKDKKDDKTYR